MFARGICLIAAIASLALTPLETSAAHAAALPAFHANDDADDRSRAVACLTSAVLYEAGHEPIEGQQAVAEVVMNRLKNPAFPKTVCGVVFQGSARRTGCQFTFTCDGSLRKILSANLAAQARAVAISALDGAFAPRVSGATYYHADMIKPYWAPSLVRVTAIGHHIFYRLPGAADAPNGLPYIPAGEQLPGARSSEQDSTATPVSRKPQTSGQPPVRFAFMPWGLAPPAQAAAETRTSSGSKE